jgi:hypothetical protein
VAVVSRAAPVRHGVVCVWRPADHRRTILVLAIEEHVAREVGGAEKRVERGRDPSLRRVEPHHPRVPERVAFQLLRSPLDLETAPGKLGDPRRTSAAFHVFRPV